MSSPTENSSSLTSDLMHNRNCFAYLLQLKPFVNQQLIKCLPGLSELLYLDNAYLEQFPYGNLYTKTMVYLEEAIDSIYDQLNPEQTKSLDNLIFSIYHNDNHILENAEWINDIGEKTRPQKVNTSKKIKKQLADQSKPINKLSPQKAENLINRFNTLFTSNFKPQNDTNLPSIKNFTYKENTDSVELRFSTQGQRHKGKVRISPLFKRWLAINAEQYPEEQQTGHIYFNNLGLDRDELIDIPGSNEKGLSLALHQLENDPALKIAVITLPASKSIMAAKHYRITDDKLPYQHVFNELLQIAESEHHDSGVTDFRISPKIRNLLFTNNENQRQVLSNLLTQSFTALGIKENETLSTAQKQAAWLHFTKFELTDFIITKLTPPNGTLSYNFTCKDAIDRGVVSSIYYNLLKSFKTRKPMSQEEFVKALHLPAAFVKGRGMNFHLQIIWNALDTYINAHYTDLNNNQQKSWLIYWRDMNCPHSRVKQLLKKRINECRNQIEALSFNKNDTINTGLKLLNSIEDQYKLQVNGQRLLLEVVSRTSYLISSSPNPTAVEQYKNLAKELKINHPILHIIAGLMEAFLGVILYLPSFGYSEALITKGIARARTGFFAPERKQLCKDILEFSSLPTPTLVA